MKFSAARRASPVANSFAARRAGVSLLVALPPEVTRIISDVHFGDRASRVARLAQLEPLLEGASQLVLNGDTLDTRSGPDPRHTADSRAAVHAFAQRSGVPFTFLTGNHDPDISTAHLLSLARDEVLATHGDILFDNIVPWSRDAAEFGRLIGAEFAALPAGQELTLELRFAIWRRAAAAIPQRHQSERHGLKHALHLAGDTIWPPTRILRIFRAWRLAPVLAVQFAARHQPAARFILTGHVHRPGIHRMPNGVVAINTGSFCPPFGGFAVDVSNTHLRVRRIDARAGEFRAGAIVAEFPLADT